MADASPEQTHTDSRIASSVFRPSRRGISWLGDDRRHTGRHRRRGLGKKNVYRISIDRNHVIFRRRGWEDGRHIGQGVDGAGYRDRDWIRRAPDTVLFVGVDNTNAMLWVTRGETWSKFERRLLITFSMWFVKNGVEVAVFYLRTNHNAAADEVTRLDDAEICMGKGGRPTRKTYRGNGYRLANSPPPTPPPPSHGRGKSAN